jgi:hypothetical protein
MKRDVFYGCSHMMGIEIEDHLILDVDPAELDIQKKAHKAEHGLELAMRSHHKVLAEACKTTLWEFIHRDVQTAYPNVMSKLRKRECVKRCIIAMPLDYALLKIQQDHMSGALDPKTDHLFVGLTRPTRTYSLSKKTGKFDMTYHHRMSISDGQRATPLTDHLLGNMKPLLNFLSDYRQTAEYWKSVNAIIDFAIVNKFKFNFIHHISKEYLKVDLPKTERPYKAYNDIELGPEWEFWDYCLQSYERMTEYEVADTDMHQHGGQVHGFHHPTMAVHKRFAKYLVNELSSLPVAKPGAGYS